ncbi:hypothetical protein [Halomonas faecis]|uniref:hypothetical protein n=1 Tax=Halomonas faecis TaxID=1562110 RepID=UPI0013D4CCD4|nr:hypothetical protein [Halomonas faecis]
MNRLNALLSIAVINGMYVLMVLGAYCTHQNIGDNGFWLTVVIGVFGVLCGWMLGVLSSPADARESKSFKKYAGVISAFLSGYLLTKIDGVIVEFSQDLLSNVAYGLRAIIFASCLISGVLIMYILRAYLHGDESANKEVQPAQNRRD